MFPAVGVAAASAKRPARHLRLCLQVHLSFNRRGRTESPQYDACTASLRCGCVLLQMQLLGWVGGGGGGSCAAFLMRCHEGAFQRIFLWG